MKTLDEPAGKNSHHLLLDAVHYENPNPGTSFKRRSPVNQDLSENPDLSEKQDESASKV
jgi:hypothetical protein